MHKDNIQKALKKYDVNHIVLLCNTLWAYLLSIFRKTQKVADYDTSVTTLFQIFTTESIVCAHTASWLVPSMTTV